MSPKNDGKQGSETPLTIKQQRLARQEARREALRIQQAKSARNRRRSIVASAIVVILLVTVIAVIAKKNGDKSVAAAAPIAGVKSFPNLSATHVTGTVKYAQIPPVGGEHSAVLLNCAKYDKPVPNENAVHSLEHGAVWVTYDPAVITGDKLTKLRKLISSTYVILSPYQGIPSPIVASAWGLQLQVSSPDDTALAAFIAKYRGAKSAPEPGAPCTGGLDGPGKLS